MNREILFRGKIAGIGKWVEGGYCAVPAPPQCFGEPKDPSHVIICENPKTMADWNMPRQMGMIDVIPETVGQFTGLTDKNGKKIFEGDILKIITTVKTDWIKDENGNYKEPKRTDCAIVQHDKNTGGYKLKVYNKGIYKRIAKFDLVHISYYYKAEVIGNIHDNPELLAVVE